MTDAIGYDFDEWRERWLRDGMPSRSPPAPPGWSGDVQLRVAGLLAG